MEKLATMKVGEIRCSKKLSSIKLPKEVTASIDKSYYRLRTGEQIKKNEVLRLVNKNDDLLFFKVERIIDGGYLVLTPKDGKKRMSLIDRFRLIGLIFKGKL